MKRNPAMLAQPHKGQDPTGWWVSEKYDGLRAIWTGEEFVSRNDKPFYAPEWFTRDLPPWRLDGELWIGKGVANFQEAVSIVRSHDSGQRWKKIRYMVFDLPDSKEPFEVVQRKLNNWHKLDRPDYVEIVPQHKLSGQADLDKRMKAMVKAGGEGLMLREPGSRYVSKRSSSLLKVKPSYDAEAGVTGYQGGTGKHTGRMGAILVYLLSDKSKKFKIGTGFSDREREDPPAIGDVVEFGYSDLTRDGIPRHPRFHRVRTDMMADRPKRKAAKPARKKTMAKKYKWPRLSADWDQFEAEGDGHAFYFREVWVSEGRVKLYVYAEEKNDGTAIVKMEGRDELKRKFPSPAAAAKWIEKVGDSEDDPTRTKPKREKARKEAIYKPKRKAAKPKAAKQKAAKPQADHFSMSAKQLCAVGDSACRAELKRRGRDATGKKV
jgi:DNA ligase-1